jgi:transcriptional regulator with XRE-family HTH domain
MHLTTLGKYFLKKREEAGLSRAALAEKSGTTTEQIETWEMTQETPPSQAMFAIIAALKIDEFEIFEILAQDSMERWRSVMLTLAGRRNKSG